MRSTVLALLLLGCGRIGFSPATDGDGGALSSSDAPAGAGAHVQTIEPGFEQAPSIQATANVTAGNLLVVASYWNTTPNTITVSDSSGLTWEGGAPLDNNDCFAAPQTTGARLWHAFATTTGAITVTVAQSDTQNRRLGMRLLEYANVGSHTGWSGRPAQSISNEMQVLSGFTSTRTLHIALFVNTNGTGTMVPGNGLTQRSIEPAFYSLIEDDAPGFSGDYVINAFLPAGVSDNCWVGATIHFIVP